MRPFRDIGQAGPGRSAGSRRRRRPALRRAPHGRSAHRRAPSTAPDQPMTPQIDTDRSGGTMYCMSERTSGNPIVIIGRGLAGGNAAATLREEGFAGPVVLLGREPGVPFGRPPLSKTYLRSEEELEGWYVRSAG